MIDEMGDTSRFYGSSGNLKFPGPGDIAKARQDRSRVSGTAGDYIVYNVPAPISSVQIDVFATTNDGANALSLLSGITEHELSPLPFVRQVFATPTNEYGFYSCIRLSATGIPPGYRFLRIALADNCQVSRVEIAYDELKN